VLRALKLDGMVERRTDGRPIRSDGDGSISLSHCDSITLAVTASSLVGCDIEASDTSDADERDELQRHVVFEVCRKLGRRPTSAALRAVIPGAVTTIADIDLVVVDLPSPSGSYTIAFGRKRRPRSTLLQPSILSISESVS
jgi:hypothetical protein